MGDETKRPWYISVADGQSLSLTVKGLLAGLVPIAVLVAKSMGLDLGSDELNAIVNQIGDLILAVGGMISIATTITGAVRKLYYKLKQKK